MRVTRYQKMLSDIASQESVPVKVIEADSSDDDFQGYSFRTFKTLYKEYEEITQKSSKKENDQQNQSKPKSQLKTKEKEKYGESESDEIFDNDYDDDDDEDSDGMNIMKKEIKDGAISSYKPRPIIKK